MVSAVDERNLESEVPESGWGTAKGYRRVTAAVADTFAAEIECQPMKEM